MCSMSGGQLGRICRAIDELAAGSASHDGDGRAQPATTPGDGAAQPAAAPGDGRAQPAAAPGDGRAQPAAAHRPGPDDADIARLAAIWEMVADADPELAKRLPGYLSAAE